MIPGPRVQQVIPDPQELQESKAPRVQLVLPEIREQQVTQVQPALPEQRAK